MSKRPVIIIAFLATLGGNCFASNAVNFLISIYQKGLNETQKTVIYSDSVPVVKGIAASAFLTGISVDIEVMSMDSISVEYNVHLVTLGAKSQSIAKRFKSEYGLPAVFNDIEVKPNSFYSLALVPSSEVDVNTHNCSYNHNTGSDFTIFPSANFDLHYLRNSLAFYHSPAIKNLFETEYRLFRDVFHFNVTSKQNLFAFPCEGYSVIWDKRFGTSLDPTRNNCYTLYGTDVNTNDPFVLIHGAVLRSYGYAPPFLSEGFTNYFSLAIHNMKKLVKSGKAIPLSKLLDTKTYLNSDPAAADIISATFVRYLIDTYTPGTFLKLYSMSDDINLKSSIETVYGKSVTALEKEWLKYVDTLHIPRQLYDEFAGRAEQMLNFPLALEYRQKALELAQSHADSLMKLEQLAGSYFVNGDYFNAAKTQERLSKLDAKSAQHLIGLAGYRMMNGEYEKAYEDLKTVSNADSTDTVVKFNLGLNYLYRGDTVKAQNEWNEIVHGAQGSQLQGESRIMLALVLRQSKNIADRQQAVDLFTVAISLFNQQIQVDPAVPNPYLWTGMALVGLSDPDNAYDQLNQALFLESRPFYIGMINLWLGKAADLRTKRDLAKKHFSKVMEGLTAAYQQEEARKYLDEAYHQ